MTEYELRGVAAEVCNAVSEATGSTVRPQDMRLHRTKCPMAVSMANRFLCHVLHCAYGLPWRRIASLTGMSAVRARNNVYELDALLRHDPEYRRVLASLSAIL